MEPTIADISEFQFGVANQLPLNCQVPLPSVWKDVAWVLTETRSSRSCRSAHRLIQETAIACGQRVGRIGGHLKCVVQTFPLEELPYSQADGRLAIGTGIPRQAEPRRDRVVI